MEGAAKTFYTPLAGERLRPLGHLSVSALIGANALLIKRFFTSSHENAKIYVCCFSQSKAERLGNAAAQTSHLRHTDVLQAFRIY